MLDLRKRFFVVSLEMADERLEQLKIWLSKASSYGLELGSLQPASADASFRRYFRISGGDGKTFIVMDAPPQKEPIDSFLLVDALMHEAGLNAPVIYEKDQAQGFILMSDLGRETYLNVINEENAFSFMDAATDALVKWQSISREGVLPNYDEAVLRRELGLFPEWYVGRHRNVTLNEKQVGILKRTFDAVVANNLTQARVFVHRDFMPRNLMVSDPMPGILDFQDALMGPVSYDIASLMRDAFISWDESFTLDVTICYWEKARKAGIPVPSDFGDFWRDVEWMGIQRHLKVLGIFARINYRDGKPKYLADTPRFIHYVRQTANRYDELKPINWLLDQIEEKRTEEAFTF